MKITKRDLLAPANLITIVGFILTIIGGIHLDTPKGFIAALLGRLLDMLDGPVARRTHSSRFGAVLDATVDKFAILAIVAGMLAYGLAPAPIILYILLQNGLVSMMNLIASARHVVIQTSLDGKHNIFLQITAMLLFALGHFCHGWLHGMITVLAYATLAASLYFATTATIGYLRVARKKHLL